MKLRTLLLLFFLCSAASAQTTLQPGTPIERELGTGEAHQFTLSLEQNNFVQLVVEQRDIDVIVKVFSPSGKSLGEFDSPNGSEGPEHVSFVALDAGNYQIVVGPLDPKDTTKGSFQIKVLEVREATEEELKTRKNLEVNRAKGVALLTEIEAIIPQIKSAQTRVRALLQIAQLLWEIDEKRASKLFANATTDCKEFLASFDEEELSLYGPTAMQLRQEVIQALATRDPDLALNFLHATSPMISSAFTKFEHTRQEAALELSIADQILRNNPKRTLQMARQSLKQGYPSNLISTLYELRRKDPQLGADLANDIAAKVLNEKLLKHAEAAFIAANLLRFVPEMSAQSTNEAAPPPLLPSDRFRELVQKVFDESMSYSQSARQSYDPAKDATLNMLAALMAVPELDTITTGGKAAVEKKIAELGSSMENQGFALVSSEKPVVPSLQEIAKMPAELREQHYINMAENEGSNGEFGRAREIITERVTNPSQRTQALKQLEQQEMYRALSQSKIADVLRILNGIRNSRERAQQVSQIVQHIGQGHKRAIAVNLLEQVRGSLSPAAQAQDQDHMNALLEIARVFSRYDVKRSFEIIDPLIEQFNELSSAARTLNGFGADYYKDDEIELQNSSPVAIVATQISSVLGTVAVVSFDRAKTTVERIRAPEVRLKAYLDIAQQTIQK